MRILLDSANICTVIRFGWELLWGVFGVVLIIVGLTGQAEGGAGYDIVAVILGVSLVGWSYWRAFLHRDT